jgi:hypothetical protein
VPAGPSGAGLPPTPWDGRASGPAPPAGRAVVARQRLRNESRETRRNAATIYLDTKTQGKSTHQGKGRMSKENTGLLYQRIGGDSTWRFTVELSVVAQRPRRARGHSPKAPPLPFRRRSLLDHLPGAGIPPSVRIGCFRRLFGTWTSRPSRALHPSDRPADSLVRLKLRPAATTAPHPHGTTPSSPPPDTRTPIVLVDCTWRSPSRSARTSDCRSHSASPA